MKFKEQFTDWMTLLTKSANPPIDIAAFNFGLFETENGYSIYLIGSKTFDTDDDDWATEVDYEPKDKYLEINPDETKGMEWNQVLEKAKVAIDGFVKSDNFKSSILKYARAITTGFDDGDLILIK